MHEELARAHSLAHIEGNFVFDRITVEPGKMNGQPCIRGMRFTVTHLLRLIAVDWTLEQMQGEFPFIEDDDVKQTLLYVARCSNPGRRAGR